MGKTWLVISLFLLTCNMSIADDWKELDLGAFKISIPKEWTYQKQHGEDSFIGEFTGLSSPLHFDFSGMGYANHLVPTINDYIKGEEWLMDCPVCKPGITYTASFNVKNEKALQMKEKGITDSTLVRVETYPKPVKKNIHAPTAEQAKKHPKADFIADLTYKDTSVCVPIKIPAEIKMYNTQVDTTDKYIIKIVYPKVPGLGFTGIYIESRKSNENFNLGGMNLSAHEQELALRVFKTIKLKN